MLLLCSNLKKVNFSNWNLKSLQDASKSLIKNDTVDNSKIQKIMDNCDSDTIDKLNKSFIQTIKLLEKEGLFCIKYHTLEGCSNCKLPISKENFYIPYIEYSELDLVNKISLDNKISNILVNSYSTFLECGYDTNHEVIINKNSYYTIITEKIYPKYLFVVFEFISDNSEEFPNYLE